VVATDAGDTYASYQVRHGCAGVVAYHVCVQVQPQPFALVFPGAAGWPQVQHDPAGERLYRLLCDPAVVDPFGPWVRRILRNRRLTDDPGRINIRVTETPFTLDQWYDQHPYGAASRFFQT